ncbi:hypothetical protein P3T76_015475 [Phytophthora citrophthora]|uniref:Uncharacterized protein n=1 Tax=Phytophthora citrophthora TaxID=4793 RepID=A0AAD9FZP7_9STRA|nr:hypothetical protein P3T76_015475 [Phytophthora citrophthora]
MAPRSSFVTEFLLRELLSALGAPLTVKNKPSDSFSESLSEETESQAAVEASNGHSQVMLVRRTNSSLHTATLVDRGYDVEAFIPGHVMAALREERGYKSIGRLRGSVVRVTKYHFATMTRCLSTDQQNNATSVSLSSSSNGKAPVYLWVDALAIVEENELAVQSLPEVYSNPLIVKRLKALSDAELEKQLMIHQGLLPLRAAEGDRFDDERPLLDEDCVIPEDQEQQLEEQEEWGPPSAIEHQPTDSQLIEENGAVPTPESQLSGPMSPGKSSVSLSGNSLAPLSDESSLDSQRFQFQQENIQETFVAGSDLESSSEDEDKQPGESKKSTITVSTPSSKQKTEPVKPSPVHSSGIVDLTDDTPESSLRATPTSKSKKVRGKTNVEDGEEKREDTAPLLSSPLPSKTQKKKKQTPAKKESNWFVESMKSILGVKPAEDPDEDEGENDQEEATQVLDQPEEEKQVETEEKYTPEEYVSSQATVVLDYDQYDDSNAFEYETSDFASPRSVTDRLVNGDNADSADELTLTEEGIEVTQKSDMEDNLTLTEEGIEVTQRADTGMGDDLTLTEEVAEDSNAPQKESETVEDTSEFKTPSPVSVRTPATAERSVSTSATATPGNNAPRASSRAASPAPPRHQLPAKSPSNLVISVDTGSSRTEPASVVSRGSKRRHHENAEDPSPATTTEPDSTPQTKRKDGQVRAKTQKRRRRGSLSTQESHETGSQLPQFEHSADPLRSGRRLQSDSISFDALFRPSGSNPRTQTSEKGQARSSRQPRRAWKRYENLFPPLNMTRLKQMMEQGNNNSVGQ